MINKTLIKAIIIALITVAALIAYGIFIITPNTDTGNLKLFVLAAVWCTIGFFGMKASLKLISKYIEEIS